MAKPDTYLESQQDDAFEAARDAGTFEPDEGWNDRRYSGRLIEDCRAAEPDSIVGMMGNIKALSDSILGNEQEAACTHS